MDVFLLIILIVIGIVAVKKYNYDNKSKIKNDFEIDIRTGKKYSSLDDWKKDLKPIWSGPARVIEFTYLKNNGAKTRRKIDLEKVLKNENGNTYLQGFCHLRNEKRTFDIMRIETKILDSNRRYEIPEWFEEKLKIDF